MNKDYTIVTVCTHFPIEPYYCLNEYIKSLQGESVLVLDGNYTQYAGLASKPKGLYKAIKEGIIPTKYLLFTDCFDFVFAVKPSEMVEEFSKPNGYNAPIVISAEKNCFPDDLKDEYDNFYSFGSSYKYLNSGMILGETEAILTCLEAMDLPNVPNDHWDEEKKCMVHPNDQFLWQQIFLKQPVKIALDYGQLFCNTLHSVDIDELEFNKLGIVNKECGCYPMSFHANGGAKTSGVLPEILKHLNLI